MLHLTIQEQERIIDILELYGGMFGSEDEEVASLVNAMKGENRLIEEPMQEINRIIDRVADATGIRTDYIKMKLRKREVVNARSYAIYRVHSDIYPKVPNLSLDDIGGLFGGFDHATVLSASSRIEDWLETNDPLITSIHENYKKGVKMMFKDIKVA